MKNCQEWLLAFNSQYNNIASNRSPGLNEYEMSCFLTDAQERVVLGLYNGSIGKPFESSEDVANFLAPLIRQAEMVEVTDGITKICDRSHVYTFPSTSDEILVKTLELCEIKSDCKDSSGNVVYNQAIVVPITQDEYWRTVRNPFKRENANRVLRLTYKSTSVTDSDGDLSVAKYSELISDCDIVKYIVRYIARPEPIILVNLKESEDSGGLTINGRWKAQTCLLDDALHQVILNEAVNMAKEVWRN